MHTTNFICRQRKLYQSLVGLFLLIALSNILTSARLQAQATLGASRTVRTLYASDWGVSERIGMTYSSKLNRFFILLPNGSSASETHQATIISLTPFEEEVDRVTLDVEFDNTQNIAFDDNTMSLLILNKQPAELFRVQLDGNQKLNAAAVTRFPLSSTAINAVDGMAFEQESSILFLLDSQGAQLISLHMTAEAPDLSTVTTVSLANLGSRSLVSLAVHPVTHHLYSVDLENARVYEISTLGEQIATYSLTSLNLASPQNLNFGFSSDLTDAPETLHLFVVDERTLGGNVTTGDNTISDQTEQSTEATDASNQIFLPIISAASNGSADQSQHSWNSRMVEVELTTAPEFVNEAAVEAITLQLVRTINTSSFSKPSPDPSGLLYHAPSNRLIMTDGEVDETVSSVTLFAGANGWELTLSGSVQRTFNVSKRSPASLALTNEPTGIAWNSNNGHYYITDDDEREVYDVNPGSDGLIGTADDSWTSFDTNTHLNQDPEGITYASSNNHIFVSDGVNAEIYEYTTSGTLVNHFDVQTYGVSDPESVDYNSATNTLFVLSNVGNRIIVETSLSGALIQSYDFSVTSALAPAGLAYAPASDGSNAKRFYIADRRVDNNDNPRENDGRIYEVTAPQSGSTATNTPVQPTNTPVSSQSTPTSTPAAGMASVTIVDQSLPQSNQNFTFYSAFDTFTLDNAQPDDGDGVGSSMTFSVSPGTYNFSEGGQSGWRLAQILCNPSNKGSVNLSQNNVTISVAAGDVVTCTFVNESTTATPQATATNTPTGAANTPTHTPTTVPSGSCPAGVQSISVRIVSSSDDAEQLLSNGTVDLYSGDLELINDGGSKPQLVGLRFPGIAIPRGATIANASIEFEVDEVDSGATSLTFRAQAIDNAPTFANSSNNISNRTLTNASVAWSNVSAWNTIDAKQQSPNLTSLLQEVINRSGWSTGNAIAFVVSGSGERTAEATDGEAPAAPILSVQFCAPGGASTPTNTPTGAANTPTHTPTTVPSGSCPAGVQSISVRIVSSSDDAEQLLSNGTVDLYSSDLELINDGGSKPQLVGLRFPGIAIPRGATIANASIEFEVDEVDSGATSLTFRAQAIDNAPTFANSSNNISNRTLTNASVAWSNVSAWNTIDAKQQSPNLTSLLQEVTSRSGWSTGNAIAFVVSGSGERTAEATDGEAPAAPILSVQFCAP